MFGDVFPATFWPLALAHGLALLSPGPDFLLVVSHSARHRFRGSAGICLGIAAGNACYIAVAIAGWMGVRNNPAIHAVLEAAGALYLFWLGARLIRASERPMPEANRDPVRVPAGRQFALGFASAALNPKNMVFYFTIMTVLVEASALLRQRVAAGIWMAGLVLAWDLLLAAAVGHPRAQAILWKRIPAIEKLCGAFLVGAAVWLTVALWLRWQPGSV